MAGLYDRVHADGLDGDGHDRITTHLIVASFKAFCAGEWNDNAIINGINTQLSRQGYQPLREDDLTDINAIFDEYTNIVGNTNKMLYSFVVEAVMTGAELDLQPENNWRNSLNIPFP